MWEKACQVRGIKAVSLPVACSVREATVVGHPRDAHYCPLYMPSRLSGHRLNGWCFPEGLPRGVYSMRGTTYVLLTWDFGSLQSLVLCVSLHREPLGVTIFSAPALLPMPAVDATSLVNIPSLEICRLTNSRHSLYQHWWSRSLASKHAC